jgi:hypothetical protein
MSNSHQGMIRITLFTSSQGDLGEGIPNVTGGLLYNNSMTIHRVLVLQYRRVDIVRLRMKGIYDILPKDNMR